MRTLLAFALVLALPAGWGARAAPPLPSAPAAGDPPDMVRAARLAGVFHLDGKLDEPGWAAATPFDRFVQLFPSEGAAPGERTEVRVLYDEANLYVGVLCEDRRPEQRVLSLGRRDSPPPSDNVQIIVDADGDRRTALSFTVTAAGVQADGLFYDDDQFTSDWDGVWDARVAEVPGGWSAELVLPLALFRFAPSAEARWGFLVRRELGRDHEVDATVLIPRNARGVASRLGTLGGLVGLRPRRDLEVAPYLASRLALRPQFSDAARARPRLLDPVLDLGLDLKARLGSSFGLVAAVNPDFGQVEADQIILNLSTFEVFRPEKRPFFQQGLDLFQPVGAGRERVPQQLFYSRRVGLETPILGAAKLTGRSGDTVQVGVLDAFVAGSGLPADATEASPDRRLRLRLAQPLHLAPGDAAPMQAPAPQNFFAGVVRWAPSPAATLGATATSAAPFGPACGDAEGGLPDSFDPGAPASSIRPRRCDVRSGNAAALDLALRSGDARWGAYGQLAASQALGGPPQRVLADGTVLRAGDVGWGGYATAGLFGGEPFRFDVHYEEESPQLDLNASGYQKTQNERLARVMLKWVRPSGGGPFHNYGFYAMGRTQWTTDGRDLNRGNAVYLGGDALLRDPYLAFGCEAGFEDPRYDVREISRASLLPAGAAPPAGVPLVRAGWVASDCWATTDTSRAVALDTSASVSRNMSWGPLLPVWSGGAQATVTLRPHPRLETQLGLSHDRSVYAVKYVDDDGEGQLTFARLHAPSLSLTLRQLVVLAPRLTLQAYAQLFADYGHYGPFWTASSTGEPITPRSLVPVAGRPASDPDFHEVALAVNVVLRWEYRLGSVLYAVYSRSQADAPLAAGPASSLRPAALGAGPTTDTALVKWSYWWRL